MHTDSFTEPQKILLAIPSIPVRSLQTTPDGLLEIELTPGLPRSPNKITFRQRLTDSIAGYIQSAQTAVDDPTLREQFITGLRLGQRAGKA